MSQIKIRISHSDSTCIYAAWEPTPITSKHRTENHGALLDIDGVPHGKISSRRIPPLIDKIATYDEDRAFAVRTWYTIQREAEYHAIIAQHPEAARGRRRVDGGIEVSMEPAPRG